MTSAKNAPSGKILAVCISGFKGIQKKDVGQGVLICGKGLEGDAHCAGGLRQVSLLAKERVDAFCVKKGIKNLLSGAFAENFLTEGISLENIPVGSVLKVGSKARLRITQIGKSCHSGCVIFQQVGDCLMPREGVFAEVIEAGSVQTGDSICLLVDEN